MLREYVESGGRNISYEEKRSALLSILPAKFREDIFFRIPAMQEAPKFTSEEAADAAAIQLRQQVQKQAELMVQWSMLNSKPEAQANMMEGQNGSWGAEPGTEGDEELYWITEGKGKKGQRKMKFSLRIACQFAGKLGGCTKDVP